MKKNIMAIMLAALMILCTACGSGAANNAANNTAGVTPDFVEHNVNVNVQLGKEASYKTVCKLDDTQSTTGKLTVTEQKRYKFGDALPTESLVALEGYEWIEVKVQTVFADDNAKTYGVDRASCVTNYYDLKYYELRVKAQDDGFTKFSVKPEDKSYDECLYIKLVDNQGWNSDRQSIVNYTWYFRVPEGYDGMVIAFLNAGTEWEDGKYIYEVLDADSLVYRVDK